MSAEELEQILNENAAAAFDALAAIPDKKEELAVAALIAQVCVATGPYWNESRQVREMLERYAALDTGYPYRPK